jgi:hypothetical protein
MMQTRAGVVVLIVILASVCIEAFLSPLSSPAKVRPSARISSTCRHLLANAPPAPAFNPKPLPVVLAGGLFLFGSSVKPNDRQLVNELLSAVQSVLNTDPTITMELGQGVETGGVYSSLRETTKDGIDQIVLQFQIQGGNVWAQGLAYGIKSLDQPALRLVSLQVANMDASMNGMPFNIPIPETEEYTPLE